MKTTILVLNAGSSSVRFATFDAGTGDDALAFAYGGEVEAIGDQARVVVRDPTGTVLVDDPLRAGSGPTSAREDALAAVLKWVEAHTGVAALAAAGHRVLHGGVHYALPVRITDAVLAELERLAPLAPAHQPHNLAAIRALARLRPDLPQIACFDTAFHRTQPPVAQAFALPRELREAGIRRYGFHGLSYEYIAGVLPAHAGAAADGRVVVAHLGHGASMCALQGRRSVATTMSFTPLDGLPMGRRCGALDPGVVLYLAQGLGMPLGEIADLLHERSGLLGVSRISDDMRVLLRTPDPRAAEAIDLFVYQIGRALGSLAAALGGLDVLVFTGGIGEHAAPIRARICRDAGWLGVRLSDDANERGGPKISAPDSAVSVWVIPTNEELVIARHVVAALAEGGGTPGRPPTALPPRSSDPAARTESPCRPRAAERRNGGP